jgi:hypothetical protein
MVEILHYENYIQNGKFSQGIGGDLMPGEIRWKSEKSTLATNPVITEG